MFRKRIKTNKLLYKAMLTTILESTALMWVSWASSLSSASSTSKVTRLALKRDFFGGAGVRDGSWSGRSVLKISIESPQCVLQKQRSPGRLPTFNSDHILLDSSILLAPFAFSLHLSTPASPLVWPAEDAGSRRSPGGQKALLLSEEVRLTVGGLGTAQHPSTSTE